MLGLQRLELAGKRFVVLEEDEYERLCEVAGEAVRDDDKLPPLPATNKHGRFPAIEYARASLARNLIRDRKSVGLTQHRLAELAGVRQEAIARLESGEHSVSVRTYDKIDLALQAERKRLGRRNEGGRSRPAT